MLDGNQVLNLLFPFSSRYRNSFFHNLCLKMLEAGYHHAFSELFNLIRDELRNAEGEDHLGQTKVSIDEHEDKLNLMKEKLIAAEIARRQGLPHVRIYPW